METHTGAFLGIYVPENPIFPLLEAEKAKLQGGEGKLPILHLPFDEGAPKLQVGCAAHMSLWIAQSGLEKQ